MFNFLRFLCTKKKKFNFLKPNINSNRDKYILTLSINEKITFLKSEEYSLNKTEK